MCAEKRESVRLTKAAAKKLIGQIARGAKIEDKGNRYTGADIFQAEVEGLELVIKCENDWFSKNGRINLIISDRWGGGSIVLCFHPDTLERDFEAEDKLRKEMMEK